MIALAGVQTQPHKKKVDYHRHFATLSIACFITSRARLQLSKLIAARSLVFWYYSLVHSVESCAPCFFHFIWFRLSVDLFFFEQIKSEGSRFVFIMILLRRDSEQIVLFFIPPCIYNFKFWRCSLCVLHTQRQKGRWMGCTRCCLRCGLSVVIEEV
jgi:hypothetical protein